jgi:4-hydroxybenzoate polyprenyltransferase
MTSNLTRSPKNIGERVLDRIFLHRIFMHYPFQGILLLGGYYGWISLQNSRNLNFWGEIWKVNQLNWPLLTSFFLFYLMMGGTYILNQIIDRETDRINRKNFFISDGHISVSSAIIQMVILYLASLSIVLILCLKNWFPGGMLFFWFFLVSAIMGIGYSLPPIRLSARPGLDMLANAVGYGFLNFSIGYLSLNEWSWNIVIISIPLTLIGLAGFGATTIADIPGDLKEGKKTIGVIIGEKKTYVLSILLFILAAGISWKIHNYILLTASLIPIPFQIWGLKTGGTKAALVTMRISNAPLVLISFIIFPLYFLGFILVGILTKLYYHKRFNVNYPAFSS